MKVSNTVYGMVNNSVGTIDTRATNHDCSDELTPREGGLEHRYERVERHGEKPAESAHRLGQ